MTTPEWWIDHGTAHITYADTAKYACGERRSTEARPTSDLLLQRCNGCVAGVAVDRFYRSITEADTGMECWRWRVEWEDGELTEVANEKLSSDSRRAVAMKGNVICLKQDDVRWLYGVLGELIQHWDK